MLKDEALDTEEPREEREKAFVSSLFNSWRLKRLELLRQQKEQWKSY